jgi:SAM-dependent methyltransferase
MAPDVAGKGFPPPIRDMMAINEANWDARTPVHVSSSFYGLDGRTPAAFWFAPFEWSDLGPLFGRDVLHLQCHLGTETIEFARRGARSVVGLDFSSEAVRHARGIAERAGVEVEYVRANVYDAGQAMLGRTFDVIYTGKGALCYLPDLPSWASLVAGLLNPGGICYLVEFHPLLNALGTTPHSGHHSRLLLCHDYLSGRGAIPHDNDHTYTDGPPLDGETRAFEWAHGLAEVVTALLGAGLSVTGLRETELLPWPRWTNMVQTEHGWWRLPGNAPRIPLLYALRAQHS